MWKPKMEWVEFSLFSGCADLSVCISSCAESWLWRFLVTKWVICYFTVLWGLSVSCFWFERGGGEAGGKGVFWEKGVRWKKNKRMRYGEGWHHNGYSQWKLTFLKSLVTSADKGEIFCKDHHIFVFTHCFSFLLFLLLSLFLFAVFSSFILFLKFELSLIVFFFPWQKELFDVDSSLLSYRGKFFKKQVATYFQFFF